MIEALKDIGIYDKVGGKFKLSALIQRRMLELMQGGRPLIDNTKGMTMMEIAVQEILEDKICISDESNKENNPALDIRL